MRSQSTIAGKTLIPLVLALAGIAVLATGCTGGAVPAPVASSPGGSFANTITVTGSGEADGTPDVANIQLGIDVAEAEVGAAMQKANDTMKAVTDAVKDKGIEDADLQTVNFSVYPEDIFDRDTGQPTGERRYHVQNFLNVKVRDIAKVGEIIDAGLTAGATNVSGLSFNVEDPSTLEADARSKALKDAQDRAQQLADAIGAKLGKPVLVTETLGGGIIYPQMEAARGAGFGAGGGVPPISTGQQTVTITVNVTYAISQ